MAYQIEERVMGSDNTVVGLFERLERFKRQKSEAAFQEELVKKEILENKKCMTWLIEDGINYCGTLYKAVFNDRGKGKITEKLGVAPASPEDIDTGKEPRPF